MREWLRSRVRGFCGFFECYGGGPVSGMEMRILASLQPPKKHRIDEMRDRRVMSLVRIAQNDSCLMGVEVQVEQ